MSKTSESGVWDQDLPESGRTGSTLVRRTPSFKQTAKARAVRDDWDDDDDEEEEEELVLGERESDVNGHTKATASGSRSDSAASILGPLARTAGAAEKRMGEEDSNTIWEEANKRGPMPELIVASASTSQCFPPPPPAALQPTLRILKRPSPSTGTNNAGAVLSGSPSSPSPGLALGPGSGSTSLGPRGTLAEREAQYQEARSRIFGAKEKVGSVGGNAGSSSTLSGEGVIVVRDPLGPASETEEPGTSGQGPSRHAKGFGERRRGKK